MVLLLYCTVHNYTALYCPVLEWNVLHCTILYCVILYCTVQYCSVLYLTVTNCTDQWHISMACRCEPLWRSHTPVWTHCWLDWQEAQLSGTTQPCNKNKSNQLHDNYPYGSINAVVGWGKSFWTKQNLTNLSSSFLLHLSPCSNWLFSSVFALMYIWCDYSWLSLASEMWIAVKSI